MKTMWGLVPQACWAHPKRIHTVTTQKAPAIVNVQTPTLPSQPPRLRARAEALDGSGRAVYRFFYLVVSRPSICWALSLTIRSLQSVNNLPPGVHSVSVRFDYFIFRHTLTNTQAYIVCIYLKTVQNMANFINAMHNLN